MDRRGIEGWQTWDRKLSPGNGADDDKRLFPGDHCVRQGGVRRLKGQVFFAGEETQEGPSLLRHLVADGPAQHGIAGLERIEDRALRDRALDFDGYLASGLRQSSQVEGQYDSDHIGSSFIGLCCKCGRHG